MAAGQNHYKTFRMRDRDDPTPASASHATGITRSVLGGTHGLMLCATHASARRCALFVARGRGPVGAAWCPSRRPSAVANCSCCCCSAGWPAQRLELITTIKAVVLMVKEHTGSTTLTGWQRVAHAARHVCRPTSSLRRLAAGGCRTLPMDRKMMPAKWFCLVVSGIDVRSLGVWVRRCGAGARG